MLTVIIFKFLNYLGVIFIGLRLLVSPNTEPTEFLNSFCPNSNSKRSL